MKCILISLLIIFNLKGYAQTDSVYSFSLTEAKEFALQNNRIIKNARLDVDASEKAKWQAIAAGLPQASIGMDYTNYFNYEIEFNFGASEDISFTQQQLNEAAANTISEFSGIPVAGISGVTLQDIYNHSAGSYYDRQLQAMMPPTTILMSDQANANLQVSQLLFNGQYFIGIQTAKLAQKLSQQSLVKTKHDVQELVSLSYYMVLLSEESIKIVEENYNNLAKTVKTTEALLKVGMAEETDVNQIKISLAMLENTKRSLNRSLELSYNGLRFQLGLEPTANIALTNNLEEIIENIDLENSLLVTFTYENNIDYQIMNTQTELSKKMVDMQKMSYLPTVAAFYNHTEKIQTTDFDMNPPNLIGLNLSWPVFSSGSRNAKYQEAKIGLEKAKTYKEMVTDQLALQEKQARYDLKNATESYLLQKENLEIAKSVYDSYNRKYEQGIISSLDLTQANGNYLNAQNSYLSSIFEVCKAKLALDKIVNNF